MLFVYVAHDVKIHYNRLAECYLPRSNNFSILTNHMLYDKYTDYI